MYSEGKGLLRMIIYTQSESARLGYSEAASHLEKAAQALAVAMETSSNTVLPDDIFRVVESIGLKKQRRRH